jgi:hypothetical protein
MALKIKRSVAVTPHDTTNLAADAQGVIATGAGTCTLVHRDGSTTQLTLAVNVPVLGLEFKRVNATGTAATGIKALYGDYCGAG